MKKILSVLVVFVLLLGIAACSLFEHGESGKENPGGTQASDDKKVQISLWTYPVGSWGNSNTVADLVNDFNKKYPNIRVSVKCLDYADGDKLVEEAIEKEEAPDLVFEGPERLVANWGERGLMADLSDLWAEDMAKGIYDNVEAACKHRDGAYYEFPVCMAVHCMAINYEMFKAADALQYIDTKNHTWTTDGFVKAVEALRASGQENVAVIYCADQGGDQGTRALINNLYGGEFTNRTHTAYQVNSEENIKALQLLSGMEGIHFEPSMAGSDESISFARGELAMAFCWNVSIEVSRTIADGERSFDIFPMAFPTDSGEPRMQGGIWGFGVFDNGDKDRIEAAKTFIRFMTEEDSRYTKAVLASTQWPVREMENIYANDALMSEYGIFMKYLGDYYQITPGWTEARRAWWNMLQKVGAGTDIAAAVEEFDRTANEAADGP